VTLNPQGGVAVDNVQGNNRISLALALAAGATGPTSVEAGTLQLDSAAQTLVLTAGSGANVKGGALVLDYSAAGNGATVASQVKSALTTAILMDSPPPPI